MKWVSSMRCTCVQTPAHRLIEMNAAEHVLIINRACAVCLGIFSPTPVRKVLTNVCVHVNASQAKAQHVRLMLA